MHLSEINNTPDAALETVKDSLKEYNVNFDNIECAKPNEISEVIVL